MSPASRPAGPRKPRADGQVTGLAGEYFVAGELLRRGLQVTVTLGTAKAVDLMAYHPETRRTFTVQVKALRERNYFPISHARVEPHHTYVFTVLNVPDGALEYYIVRGDVLATQPERFDRYFVDPKFPGIHPKSLQDFRDAWATFGEAAPTVG
jgi:transposase-like protein